MELFQARSMRVEVEGTTAWLWLDVPDRAYNVLGRDVMADLHEALNRVEANNAVKLLVFLGKKKNGFLAGADLNEFKTIRTPDEAKTMSAKGQELMHRVAGVRMPTIAVIHGPCLGGGLEFALACDYRVAVDQSSTQIGLPEIELGLLPGWGGTQRLPRVVGVERAMQVILQRHRLNAREAKEWGLADAVADSQDAAISHIRRELATVAESQGKRPKQGLPLRTWRQRLLESNPIGRSVIFSIAGKLMKRKVPDDMPAPLEALAAIRVGISRGMDAGFRQEREAIGRLATTTACRNLVTLFFLIMNARKAEQEGEETKKDLPIRKVGVVGAGTMGAGIAQLAAVKGFDVVVQEINDNALAAGMKKIQDLFSKAAERRVISRDEARKKFEAIGKTTKWEGFETADLVIEAALEDLDKKREIFRLLDQRMRPDAILATNTSSLLVRQMAEGLQHPERLAGLHFFNPVHKMPLVEVVRAPKTNETVLANLTQWAAAVGKTPVVVGDSPGFVVNRILMPYLNEAGILLAEGLGVEHVDRVMMRFGMPMGPLELLDTVGLDVAAHIARAIGPAFGERLKPHPALQQMCEFGWLGQKSGKGFYLHQGKKKRVHTQALRKLAGETKQPPTKVSADRLVDARERMVCLMVNEAAACLAEGLGERADVIDLAMVLGTGWAPHRGGPLRYADDRGAAAIVKALEELTRKHGPRFEPCAELKRRAESGELFYSSLAEVQAA